MKRPNKAVNIGKAFADLASSVLAKVNGKEGFIVMDRSTLEAVYFKTRICFGGYKNIGTAFPMGNFTPAR